MAILYLAEPAFLHSFYAILVSFNALMSQWFSEAPPTGMLIFWGGRKGGIEQQKTPEASEQTKKKSFGKS